MGPMSGNGSHMCGLKFIFIVAETHWAIQYFIVQLLFIFSVVLPLLSPFLYYSLIQFPPSHSFSLLLYFYSLLPPLISPFPTIPSSYFPSPLNSLMNYSSSFSFSSFLSFGTHPLYSLSRYYAICCQPLVYRNKMTPLRIALMLGGCWVIPMFISFLPIMQGWNNIGIIDLVSTHADPMGLLSD